MSAGGFAQTQAEPSLLLISQLIRPSSEQGAKLEALGLAQCAHIMAMAVQRLRPRVQVTIGPWIERGFYYDFDTPEDERLTEADLKVIKKEMQRIIKADLPFTCEEVRLFALLPSRANKLFR